MHPTNGELMRSIRDWNRYYGDRAKSSRGVQGTWKCDGTPMLTILGHTLNANDLAPFLKKWAEKCFGQKKPDHLRYWESIVILPPIMTSDTLMTVIYTSSSSSSSSSSGSKQQVDESKLNMSFFNGDQIWAECELLMEESTKRMLNEVGVNAGEEEGPAVEDLSFMEMFLNMLLLHPGFGRLMRGFNLWNIMNGSGTGKI